MYEVQSSHSQVQQIANEMENVIQSITGVKQNVETANRTTVSGNETAKTTINEHKSMMIQLMNVFKQDVERLQTIALEFNRTDVEAANMYRKLI